MDKFRNGLHNSLWAQPACTPGSAAEFEELANALAELKNSISALALFPTQRE
jgi:hypothetical protein